MVSLKARCGAARDSDLDYLVDIDPDRTGLDLSAPILDLQVALGCAVDVKEVAGDGRDSERIRREAIAL